MEIDIKDRLAIYELAYNEFMIDYNSKNRDTICDGMCRYLRTAYIEHFKVEKYLWLFITNYNLTPALLEFKKYVPDDVTETYPYTYYSKYWWNLCDWETRKEVFIDLINKTKKLIEDVQND